MVILKFLVEKVTNVLVEGFNCRCSRRKSVTNVSFELFRLYYGEILLSA